MASGQVGQTLSTGRRHYLVTLPIGIEQQELEAPIAVGNLLVVGDTRSKKGRYPVLDIWLTRHGAMMLWPRHPCVIESSPAGPSNREAARVMTSRAARTSPSSSSPKTAASSARLSG